MIYFSVKELNYIKYHLDFQRNLNKKFSKSLDDKIGINNIEYKDINQKLNKEILEEKYLDYIKSFIRLDNHMADVGRYFCILSLDERKVLSERLYEMLLYNRELLNKMRCKNGKENI